MSEVRLVIVAIAATAALPAHATMPILPPASVPGIGLFGVIATGVAAAVIAWWRMRK
ncbi:MAG: hypothetical protein U1F51_20655 [Burkholderiales bacterium]